MKEELFRKLYCLSFSGEDAATVLVQVTEAFTKALALEQAVVRLKTAGGYSVVAGGVDGQESNKLPILNGYGKKVGELAYLPGENACLSPFEESILKAFVNQLGGLLERLAPEEQETGFICREELDKYKRLLSTDSLTGLYNRRYFEESLAVIESQRQYPLSLIFVDVDGLKIINDHLGHKFGDMALQQTAVLLRSAFRENDLVARLGGDEFVVVLPQTSQEIAKLRCASLIKAASFYNMEHALPPLSLSVGVAATDGAETMRDLLHRADLEMYKQKQKKRLRYGNFLRNRCLTMAAVADNAVQQYMV